MKTLHDLTAEKLERPDESAAQSPARKMFALPAEPTFADLLARAVADKIEGDASLLRIPLENIDRWKTQDVLSTPRWHLRWKELLEQARSDSAALRKVLELLRSDTEEARRWRDFSPFAGVLSSIERRRIIRQCAYSH